MLNINLFTLNKILSKIYQKVYIKFFSNSSYRHCLNDISNYLNISFEEIEPLLDLVAVSIAADIVPMTGENRILAFYGLKQINGILITFVVLKQ